MEVKVILCIVLLFFIRPCNNKPPSIKEQQFVQVHKSWHVGLKDTVLIDKIGSAFVKYHLKGDTIYKLEWGNDSIINYSKKDFDVLGNGILNMLDGNNYNIVLYQSCGTSCDVYVILPLKSNSAEKEYYFAKAYDLKNELIAYLSQEDGVLIRVENFNTGRFMDLQETNLCLAAIKGDCIDEIKFADDYLIVKWQGKKWTNDNQDPKEKRIRMELN